jgi:hypothetical protein
MTNQTVMELGRSYAVATTRAHKLLTDFYEDLFDKDGNPIENPTEVATKLASFRQKLNLEFDLVKEAAYQFYEEKYGFES